MSIEAVDLKFTSVNSIPVDRATVTKEEWEAVKGEIERLRRVAWGVVHNAKFRHRRSLWWIVAMITGLGSSSARALCKEFGRDPDQLI